MSTVLGWHFTGDTLRDGRPVPAVGETLVHDGPVVICDSGLHFSRWLIDALRYAPGPMIHRVECRKVLEEHYNKAVCRERTILWTVDGEEILRDFARRCVLDVIHLCDAPEVVVKYLRSGDADLKDAAWDAAWGGTWDATRGARCAAQAARAAAWEAARYAASGSARATAWDTAWGAARAARDAAWEAARAAVREAAWSAASAAAWDAAWEAASARQNRRLTAMVSAARRIA